MESPLGGHYGSNMLALLCASLVSSAPVVEASVETTPKRQLSFTGVLVGAWGLSPGDPFTLNVGARFRQGRISFGLEAQPLMPGAAQVTFGELEALVPTRTRIREIPAGTVIAGVRGVGVIGLVPVCVEWGAISTCAVMAAGALSLDSNLLPLVSAGARVAGEFPKDSPVRFRASAQLLGGIVRPAAGTFWQTSPVQLGVSAGIVADVL